MEIDFVEVVWTFGDLYVEDMPRDSKNISWAFFERLFALILVVVSYFSKISGFSHGISLSRSSRSKSSSSDGNSSLILPTLSWLLLGNGLILPESEEQKR